MEGEEMEFTMDEKEYYSIGEVCKICNISTKALRYYDRIGVLSPDYVSADNGYRYYTKKTLLSISVLKYYKQMGFKLEEMQGLLKGEGYPVLQMKFQQKMDILKMQEEEIRNSYAAIKEWYELIQEGEIVYNNRLNDISVKFLGERCYCYMEQRFDSDYRSSLINIPWTNYLEENDEQIVGAVIISYDSFEEKRKNPYTQARILQKPVILNEKSSIQIKEQIGMAICVYHIGSHETINEEYDRIKVWAKERGIKYAQNSYERFVVDYWSTEDPNLFVTEIIVPIVEKEDK